MGFHYRIIISLVIFTLSSTIEIVCAQQWINDTIKDEIEHCKTAFRKKGLNTLDPIEGVYLAKLKRSSRSLIDYSDSNKIKTDTRNIVIVIVRSSFDSFKFHISRSTDGVFSYGKYLPPDISSYRFYIRKIGADYQVASNPTSITRDEASRLDFINNSILFQTREYFPRLWDILDEIEMYEKIYPSTVEHNIYKSGTGFIISSKGYIITNQHVVSDASNIYLSNEKYKRIRAKIVYQNESDDIAILKTDININCTPYKITMHNSSVGSDIFTLGFPLSNILGKNVKLTSGIINANIGYEGSDKYLQFSAEIEAGNSGSPLFNKEGDVIGLVTAKVKKATNVGYALKAKELLSHIKLAGIETCDITPSSGKTDLPSMYERNRNYIFYIEVE